MKNLSLLAALFLAVPAAAQCDRDRDFIESLSKDAAVQKADVPKVAGKPVEKDSKQQEKKNEKKDARKASLPFPDLSACQATAAKLYPGSGAVMITDVAVYYQHNDCDICDEVDRCELKTGKITHEITAHFVSCSDLDQFRKTEKIIRDCIKY